jgi:hypothetical protein
MRSFLNHSLPNRNKGAKKLFQLFFDRQRFSLMLEWVSIHWPNYLFGLYTLQYFQPNGNSLFQAYAFTAPISAVSIFDCKVFFPVLHFYHVDQLLIRLKFFVFPIDTSLKFITRLEASLYCLLCLYLQGLNF